MWLTYILGPFLAALPRRWRGELFPNLPIRWERAAFLSGALEVLLSIPLLAVWYAIFIAMFTRSGGASYGPGAGMLGTLGFWFNPITWFCIYLAMEGILRALGGLFAGEARGMAILSAGRWLYLRAKPDWQYPHTIRYSGGYFQVVSYQNFGAGPRPHVYSLRRLPQGEIAGGLKEYHPEDVLAPPLTLQRIEP